ncbi:MAG TPA: cupin domain-containing protein [Candidatus Binatia bacterium]|nr:cupin domain-containing protein [Candidatus Binatia bacterium]
MPKITVVAFFLAVAFASTDSDLPEMRLSADEVITRASQQNSNRIGSSGVPGVHSTVLYGDPSKPGFYTILLYVPAHTTIQAHSHRDNRMAAVLSGTWHFGYGTKFDESLLKNMPPGSVYSEPAGTNHFARTDDLPSIVEVSGVGPTDTVYFDPANDPARKPR